MDSDAATRLDGRVAIVTGAARGQGRGITHRLAEAGAHVVATDLRDEVHTLAEELRRPGQSEILDVTDQLSWQRVVACTTERLGRIDILVNNAVVNTLSTAAVMAWSHHAAYASSKWALRGLTKVAALELAADGIRVNAVVPGPVLRR